MARKYKHMTAKEFKKIKAVLDAGVSVSHAIKIVGRSAGTINRIKRSKSFSEYKKLIAESSQKHEKNQEKSKDINLNEAILKELIAIRNELMKLNGKKGVIWG